MPFGIHGVKKETLQKYGQKIQDKASKFAKDARRPSRHCRSADAARG